MSMVVLQTLIGCRSPQAPWYIFAKANKVLGLIRRTFGAINSEGVSIACKTLVHPILAYGCQVLNPYSRYRGEPLKSFCGSEKEYQERLGVSK